MSSSHQHAPPTPCPRSVPVPLDPAPCRGRLAVPCSAPRGVRAAGSVPASTARSRGAGDASLAASLAPQGAIAPVQDQHGPVRPAQVRPRVVLRGPVQPGTDRQRSALPRIDHSGPAQVGISQYSPGQPHTDLPIPPHPSPSRPAPSRSVPSGLSSRQRRAPGATCRDRGSAPAPRAQLQLPARALGAPS